MCGLVWQLRAASDSGASGSEENGRDHIRLDALHPRLSRQEHTRSCHKRRVVAAWLACKAFVGGTDDGVIRVLSLCGYLLGAYSCPYGGETKQAELFIAVCNQLEYQHSHSCACHVGRLRLNSGGVITEEI